ncbi:MAG: hypothetical protein ABW032_01525, partial [Burkholderiaceae bacterium]
KKTPALVLPRSAAAVLAALAMSVVASAARAPDERAITNIAPAASAASAALARRTLKFNTRHDVAAMLTSRRAAPIPYGWKADVRFAGQTGMHRCEFDAPKTSIQVREGETAVMTIRCTTPWQLYDNGLAFEAFEGGRKAAEGILRP